uniref:Multidrug resistance-associated protein 4-like n=1 Tax=Saccoglossus kowalevskii TaxID=10224 RepID=A0ABM0LUE9_SACKO|nr:PREDICTED: multidrug resistance-associated protein 4-like [Saccoglossus kowalevskii]
MNTPFEQHPWEFATCLSKLSFWWLHPILKFGYTNQLKCEHLYSVPKEEASEKLTRKLEKEWETEASKNIPTSSRKPSLFRAIRRTFGRNLIPWVFAALFEGFFSIIQCFFLQKLVWYFTPNSGITTFYAYLYAAGLSLSVALIVIVSHPESFGLARIGMRIRVGCSSLIYKKLLKLNHVAMQETNSGQVINLLANDVYRFDTALSFINSLWTGPVMIIVVYALVFLEIGPYALASLVLTLIMIPFQILIGRLEAHIRDKTVVQTDDRVRCLSEVITGMRDIKMHNWEEFFSKRVKSIRQAEINQVSRSSYLQATVFFLYCSWSMLSGFATFLPYVLSGHSLQAYQVFYALALYDVLREYTFYDFPTALQYSFEAIVSITRLQNFLLLDEWNGFSENKNSEIVAVGSIDVKDMTASWSKTMETPVLHQITMDVKPGELIAVIGPVGCGKSSLLRALMSDLTQESEKFSVAGTLSYGSQQPWIFKDTLKENIIFGNTFDEKKYQTVLEVCNLVQDIASLPEGDLTSLGEKGEVLSGGQRSRVSLARAVYHNADIYLIEDPFSALDYKIARDIMDKCVCGYLSGKTRILVTHQTQYLDTVDKVLVLKEGEVLAFGTLQEIQNSGIDCADVIRECQQGKQRRVQAKRRWGRLAVTLVTTGAFKTTAQQQRKRKRLKHRSVTSFGKGHFMTLPSSYNAQQESYLSEDYLKEIKARKAGRTEQEDEAAEDEDETEEESGTGHVGLRVYAHYLKAGFGIIGSLVVLLISILAQALYISSDWWLSIWVDGNIMLLHTTEINDTLIDNVTMPTSTELAIQYDATNGSTNSSIINIQVPIFDDSALSEDDYLFLVIYSSLVAASILFGLTRTVTLFKGAVHASKNLHNQMFDSIMQTSICFFDNNPTGRILNRFSKDVGITDDLLPFSFVDFVQHTMILLGILIVVFLVNPYAILPTLPLIGMFVYLRRYFLMTSNDIKRLEGVTRSPVFSHISNTLNGIWTIRSARVEHKMEKQFFQHEDKHSSAWFLFLATTRWFAIRLDILVWSLDAGFVGLSLAYSLNLIGVFQWCVRASTDVEGQMISVERIIGYTNLTPESDPNEETQPPIDWPSDGAITFRDVSYSYSEDGPLILTNIGFSIKPKEKVGVVGRSGSGKSTVIEALLRMSKPTGVIAIDGIPTTNVKVTELRNRIAVIPQVPMLFSGTLRMNLDPSEEYDDEHLWKVIDQVDLRDLVVGMGEEFDSELCEGGSNLSVGQRQLVCLARAILQGTRILVIDEATANVDATTDMKIQKTIRDQFKDCTVLTIAHRLNTIIDSDRIMVVQTGNVIEFDEPLKLMEKEEGVFCSMVTASKMSSKIKSKLRQHEHRKVNEEQKHSESKEHENNTDIPNGGASVDVTRSGSTDTTGLDNDTIV